MRTHTLSSWHLPAMRCASTAVADCLPVPLLMVERGGCGILQVFQLPTALAYPLFYKLAQPGASTVSLQAVQSWIVQQKVMQVRQPNIHVPGTAHRAVPL